MSHYGESSRGEDLRSQTSRNLRICTIRIFVRGRVQGVAYRAWTKRRAEALGLAGWVRNRRTGEVEAVFSGPADAVEKMIEACRQGPPLAEVEGVEVQAEAEAPPASFTILPSR